jgi:hypothetical protein
MTSFCSWQAGSWPTVTTPFSETSLTKGWVMTDRRPLQAGRKAEYMKKQLNVKGHEGAHTVRVAENDVSRLEGVANDERINDRAFVTEGLQPVLHGGNGILDLSRMCHQTFKCLKLDTHI